MKRKMTTEEQGPSKVQKQEEVIDQWDLIWKAPSIGKRIARYLSNMDLLIVARVTGNRAFRAFAKRAFLQEYMLDLEHATGNPRIQAYLMRIEGKAKQMPLDLRPFDKIPDWPCRHILFQCFKTSEKFLTLRPELSLGAQRILTSKSMQNFGKLPQLPKFPELVQWDCKYRGEGFSMNQVAQMVRDSQSFQKFSLSNLDLTDMGIHDVQSTLTQEDWPKTLKHFELFGFTFCKPELNLPPTLTRLVMDDCELHGDLDWDLALPCLQELVLTSCCKVPQGSLSKLPKGLKILKIKALNMGMTRAQTQDWTHECLQILIRGLPQGLEVLVLKYAYALPSGHKIPMVQVALPSLPLSLKRARISGFHEEVRAWFQKQKGPGCKLITSNIVN